MSPQTLLNWWLVNWTGLACLICICISVSISTAEASSLLTLTKHSPTLNEPFQASNFERLPHVPCVTLFHKEGRVGCGTYERDSVTGTLVPWSTAASSSSSVGSYVAVMDQSEFTNDNLDSLTSSSSSSSSSSSLVGILVLNATTVTSMEQLVSLGLSPAPQNPQGEGTPSAQVSANSEYAWNAHGDGLTNRNLYGIPTVLVTSDSVSDYLLQVATDQASQLQASSVSGDTEPSVVAEFNYYMGPEAMDSQTCLEWRDTDGTWSPKCLPLGGNSIWATAGSPELVQEQQDRRLEQGSSQKDIVIMATSMDATSMFHDAVPAANAAASNILTLLMAAKLVGSSLSDETLDALPKRILFGFFQGESYGFLGSRSFLQDVAYPGFTCDEGRTVYQNSRHANDGDPEACLYPLRPNLAFSDLGDIAGMIALDQVGVLTTENTLYVHGDAEEGTFDGFLANVLLALSSDDFTVAASSVEGDYPPTPLTSLMQLSEGGVGGAILSGYDDAFATGSMYHSHLDSNFVRPIDMDAIAAAATIMARAALATASDDGDMDSDTAAQNAATAIPSLSSDDETLLELADCFFTNGNCKLLIQHGLVERANTKQATGLDLGLGSPLGTPPNYYTGIYNADEGQPFVQVGTSYYGAYTGDEYGKKTTDAFVTRPLLLEMAIHGLLNDYLGRGSRSEETTNFKKCSNTDDCSKVSYCSATGDSAVCTGNKQCVCSRANFHIAVDEAFVAAPNNFTGHFDVTPVYTADEDGGDGESYIRSAMYTEAFWSSSVGVRVYRDAGKSTGTWALVCGILTFALCIGSTLFLKKSLKKEKLY